ncbi:MAG: sporulation protein YunB [Oscillospiraceae bacterium]|nr:sporulation protein YunB [Oscillospiraceae bacterium]
MYHRPLFRRRIRPNYPPGSTTFSPQGKRRAVRAGLLMCLAVLVLLIISSSIYLKSISTQIASADAKDVITERINDAIVDTLNSGDYGGDYFVTFQKADNGDVTAVSSNMARINELSSKILDKLVDSTRDNTITIGIPAGNLTGASLLMGRGAKIPVKIVVLSSSRVEFMNNIVTAGINQTKHQITLRVTADMQILVPWGTEDTQVSTDVLIADTVIVGKVPDTYLNMQ